MENSLGWFRGPIGKWMASAPRSCQTGTAWQAKAAGSASAVCQAKAEILTFGFMEIGLGVMIEIFGDPESLTVFGDNTIDTLAVAIINIFFLQDHQCPFLDCA